MIQYREVAEHAVERLAVRLNTVEVRDMTLNPILMPPFRRFHLKSSDHSRGHIYCAHRDLALSKVDRIFARSAAYIQYPHSTLKTTIRNRPGSFAHPPASRRSRKILVVRAGLEVIKNTNIVRAVYRVESSIHFFEGGFRIQARDEWDR